jgi:hypothetical protein
MDSVQKRLTSIYSKDFSYLLKFPFTVFSNIRVNSINGETILYQKNGYEIKLLTRALAEARR